MSVKTEIERLKVIPGAEKLKDYASNQKETLAELEFHTSFSRERLLEKLMEKAENGEPGYRFFSATVRPQIAERLGELIQERWIERLTSLGYQVSLNVKHGSGFYSRCELDVVWDMEGWEALCQQM